MTAPDASFIDKKSSERIYDVIAYVITEVSGWERRHRKLEKECKMYNAQLKPIIRDD